MISNDWLELNAIFLYETLQLLQVTSAYVGHSRH